MALLKLITWNDQTILFEGDFDSWKDCLESAVDQNVSLDHILLENMDLQSANLDGAQMDYAHVRHCDLRGANLSEVSMIKSKWSGCNMGHACMWETQAIGAQFIQCRMNDVDVAFCDMRGLMVTCPLFLKNDFSRTTYIGGATYMAHGSVYPMSRGPLFVQGLTQDVVFLDSHIVIDGLITLHHDQLEKMPFVHAVSTDVLKALWQRLRSAQVLTFAA